MLAMEDQVKSSALWDTVFFTVISYTAHFDHTSIEYIEHLHKVHSTYKIVCVSTASVYIVNSRSDYYIAVLMHS